jgi:hypothetical protein
VLYLRLTRSLVVSPPLMPLAMLGRVSRGRGTERFEPVVWASHPESVLRSRGWIWRGADMVGRVVVFLRRSDKPFLSSDIVQYNMALRRALQCAVGGGSTDQLLRSSRGLGRESAGAGTCSRLQSTIQNSLETRQHRADHNNTHLNPLIPS